jgi:hypothetical protein
MAAPLIDYSNRDCASIAINGRRFREDGETYGRGKTVLWETDGYVILRTAESKYFAGPLSGKKRAPKSIILGKIVLDSDQPMENGDKERLIAIEIVNRSFVEDNEQPIIKKYKTEAYKALGKKPGKKA